MGKRQTAYILAKQACRKAEADLDAAEKDFLHRKGRVEDNLDDIEDMGEFEQLLDECYNKPEVKNLVVIADQKRDDLKKAEDVLIDMAMLVAPKNIRKTLEAGRKTKAVIRQKLIDIAMKMQEEDS